MHDYTIRFTPSLEIILLSKHKNVGTGTKYWSILPHHYEMLFLKPKRCVQFIVCCVWETEISPEPFVFVQLSVKGSAGNFGVFPLHTIIFSFKNNQYTSEWQICALGFVLSIRSSASFLNEAAFVYANKTPRCFYSTQRINCRGHTSLLLFCVPSALTSSIFWSGPMRVPTSANSLHG